MTLDKDERGELWKAISKLVRQHRTYSTAEWAMSPTDVDRLAAIASRLQPEDPGESSRWLFDTHTPELGVGKRMDVPNYSELVAEKRRDAVRAIFQADGLVGLLELAQTVELPWALGVAAATAELQVEPELVDLLDSDDAKSAEFAFAYCARRVEMGGTEWIRERLSRLASRPLAQARLVQGLDDLPTAWQLAQELGTDVASAYWREFRTHGRGADFSLANEAAQQLLEHGRPGAALDVLNLYMERGPKPASPELIADAMERLLALPAGHLEFRGVSDYELDRLLEYLRASGFDEDRVALLEWRFLPALGFQAQSPTLHRRMARDPAFFVEILSLCFKPRNADEEDDQDRPPGVAENAFRLLREWKIVPGTSEDGHIEEDELRAWIVSARDVLAKADRLSIGETYIGHVLAHAPGDEDESWPTLPVRNVIEWAASTTLEDGLSIEIYNKRGVTSRGLTDGGRQERDLASHFKGLAERISDRWPRTRAILRRVAEGYENEAKREDESAERFLRGHER